MNNDALVGVLGVDAVAAVRGYRLAVVTEAARRGQLLVSDAPSERVPTGPDAYVMVDPIDIRLRIVDSPGADVVGCVLHWSSAFGWALSRSAVEPPFAYYAAPRAAPPDLVPTPSRVLDWMVGDAGAHASPPSGVELDDDPAAIQGLLGFANPKYLSFLQETFADRAPEEIRARLRARSPVTEGPHSPYWA